MCGKNWDLSDTKKVQLGSPPRVREKPLETSKEYYELGITPACAGKTYAFGFLAPSMRDHPRVCGKNMALKNTVLIISGSPPRVREKRTRFPIEVLSHGITPACAGKTLVENLDFYSIWDHPRVCGKNKDYQSTRV